MLLLLYSGGAASGVHNLLADDIQSTSQVSSPSLGQIHALTATSIQSASSVSSPVIAQVHALNAADVESASQVSAPAIGVIHNLSANDVESASEVSSPVIGQIHGLAANDIESASEVSSPVLAVDGVNSLLADDIESASQVSSPTLGQIHVLAGVSLQSLSEVSIPALNGATAVVVTPPQGGIARRGTAPRKRYYVEIDGQYFEVDSQAEGEALLRRALSTAEVIATEATARNAKRIKRGRRLVTPELPSIKSSPELQPLADEYRERIESIYRQIAVDSELRELMRLKMAEDDDEDAIFVLLH